mmetsp:Transcript_1097/g.1635  ORF Transcript_1097/g.1635 Transcript_1097/m.1635 type:complete len:129 (+) Transcript_1097:15-401(+)
MTLLYHLIEKDLWDTAKAENKPYYPPAYEQDGFVHLTDKTENLLFVGNHFYTGIGGDFLVIELDSDRITDAEVKYELARPVGDQAPPEEHGAGELFPHLYGPVLPAYVTRELAVARGGDGAFVAVEGC